MARQTKPKRVEALTHEDASRKNIPTAEYQTALAADDRSPIEVAYERTNRDLDPQLVWRGKDVQDWADLVVPAPPLFIQEKVHPKALIDDLLRQSAETRARGSKEAPQVDLFADFNGLPDDNARTEFYQHDANWAGPSTRTATTSKPPSDAAPSYGLVSMPSRARACPSEDRAWLEAICC